MNWKKIGLGASLASILGSIVIYFGHDENLGIFSVMGISPVVVSDRVAEMTE